MQIATLSGRSFRLMFILLPSAGLAGFAARALLSVLLLELSVLVVVLGAEVSVEVAVLVEVLVSVAVAELVDVLVSVLVLVLVSVFFVSLELFSDFCPHADMNIIVEIKTHAWAELMNFKTILLLCRPLCCLLRYHRC